MLPFLDLVSSIITLKRVCVVYVQGCANAQYIMYVCVHICVLCNANSNFFTSQSFTFASLWITRQHVLSFLTYPVSCYISSLAKHHLFALSVILEGQKLCIVKITILIRINNYLLFHNSNLEQLFSPHPYPSSVLIRNLGSSVGWSLELQVA